MYGLPDSTLPGVGKVELSWLSTPLPPVDVSKFAHDSGNGNGAAKQEEDVDMGDAYQSSTTTTGQGQGYVGFEEHGGMGGNLDYDEEEQVW